MADLNNAYNALRAAHAAGDTEAAKKLANYINQVQSAAAEPAEFVEAPEEKPLGGFWDSLIESAQTLGLADEATAFAANPNEENRKALLAAGNSKFRGVGFGEGENWAAFKQLLGGSLGQMVAPVAAATAGSFATPIAGVAAGFGASAAQYEAQNLLRQAQEQERAVAEGRAPQELELGKSLAASATQAGLDVLQFKYFEKLMRALPFTRNLLLPEKEAAQKAADELVDSYKAGTLKATPMGTVKDVTKGAAFEVPQELAQTVLERWQAGLSLSDDEAQEEYKQAAIGAAVLGPLMGGAAGYAGRAGERTAAQAEIERREAQAELERSKQELAAIRQGAAPPPKAPPEGTPPAPPAAQQEADFRRTIEDEQDEMRFAMEERDNLYRQQYDADILREAAEAEALAPVDEDIPYYPPAVAPAPADVGVATEDLVATEVAPEPDLRNLALEAIKTTPTIKAISEATGLNQPKAAAIMNGFVDEGLVERKGNRFKLIEPKAAETAVKTAEVVPFKQKSQPQKPLDVEKAYNFRHFDDTKGGFVQFNNGKGYELYYFNDGEWIILGTEDPSNFDATTIKASNFQDAAQQIYERELAGNPYPTTNEERVKQLAVVPVKSQKDLTFAERRQEQLAEEEDLREEQEPTSPTTPPEAPRGTEPVTSETVGGAGAGSAELPVSRAPAEGRGPARAGTEGLGVPSAPAARVDEREEGVEPALTTTPGKNARAVGLEYVRSTGKADALGLQKATGLKLSEVKALRDALIGSGAIVSVPGKKNFYQVFEEYKPTAVRPVREEAVEETTDEAVIEAARDRATARMRAKNAEAIKAQERADEASERAPAPPLRPTYKGLPKGTLAEDTRRAFAALEAEEAAKKQPKEASAQQGLDLLGGMAKPSLSRAETQVLSDIKSAARFLNTSGQMNDQDRERYNAEIKKPKPDLVKLRKLVDKISSREPDDVGGIERNEDFYTDREQYELDEETYFYERPDEYTRRGELKPLKFRRGEGKGLPINRVQETVSRIVKGWKNAPKIIVVQSADAIPGQNFSNTQGVYVDGQVYLVADNLDSDAEVKATLFHESLGHFGLEQVFGKRLKEVMLNLYRTNKAVREQADRYLELYPDTYAGETREDQLAFAVEEVIAEASVKGPKTADASALRSAFNRVANLIRKFLNAMGFPVTYTNKEVNEILMQAHGAVIAGQRKDRIGDGTAKYQRKRAEERLSKVFDYNLTAPTYNSKIGDGVRGAYGNISDKLRDASLGMLAIKDQAEIWKKELPSVEELDEIASSRGAAELSRREEVGEYVEKFYKVSKKHSTEVMNHFFAVANMTTVYQVDPLNPADLAILNKPVNKMDGQDRAAYDILKEFEALPEDLQKSYKELREFYEDKSKQLFDLLAARLGTDVVGKLKAKYDAKRLKVYLPLYRRGDYWLTYTDKNNETITAAYASDIDRKRGRDAAAADGGKDFQAFSRLTEARRNGPPPTGFLGEIVSTLQGQGAPEDMIDSVYETFLNYLPAESIRQQFQSREASYDPATGTTRYGKFGFEPDVFQAFANVATRMANQLTNLEYAIPIENVMNEIKKQAGGAKSTNPVLAAVHNNLTKQVDFIRNPQSNWAVDGASYFSYMWFIAGNISSALVNTTQLPLVVAPLLGGKYGYGKATSAIEKAFKTYFNGGFDTNSDFSFGAAANLDPKYKKLYDTAVSRSVIRRATSYDITELQKASTKDYVGTKAKVMKWLGWTFQNSERFNREITLLAAFDLAYARTGNLDAAINEAMKLTNDAHGVALTETGPRLFQQGFGKVMFTFKRFAQAQIYLLSKLFNQAFRDSDKTTREVARSQLVGIFGSSYILAGVQGMPLYGAAELLATLTHMAIGDDDEPFDATAYVDSALTETGRKGLINKFINLDIAARTGFNGMLWREDYKRMGDVGPVLYTLEQAMGPAYAAAMGVGRGIGLAFEGEYQRAVEAIAPSYIRNAWKTLRYAEEGVRNKDGVPVVENVGDYNLMMQLVGFAPSEVSYARERASAASKLSDKLVSRRSSLLDQYYAAWQEQDAEGMDEALDNIMKFNAKNPQKGLAITQSTLRKSINGRVTRQEQSVDGLYLPMSVRNRIAQILPGD